MTQNTSDKKKAILKELGIVALLFLAAYAFNMYALLSSKTPFFEAILNVKPALILSGIGYVCVGMFRLFIRFFGKSVKSFDKYSNPEKF